MLERKTVGENSKMRLTSKTDQERAGHNRTGHDRTGHDRAGHDRTERTEYDEQNRTAQDWT